MASSAFTSAQTIVDTLTTAGLYATMTPRAVDGLCVLVTPPNRAAMRLTGGYTASWELMVIAPGNPDDTWWSEVDGAIDAVCGVLPIDTVTAVEYQGRAAYLLTLTSAESVTT